MITDGERNTTFKRAGPEDRKNEKSMTVKKAREK